ncbi:helix-turn-helix transcriptional regulator [Paenibacillus marinisediminis]
MKIDRLLSIVILLINRKIVQAKDLADTFEVSVRTIYRDIEAINQAGIPIVTYQGANGGISLAEGYRLDRNLLTNDELAAIVTALQSIASSHQSPDNQMLLEKITSIIPPSESERFNMKTQQMIVDFSPWGSHGRLEEKLVKMKQAIEEQHPVTLTYCSADGSVTTRSIEPYTLVLKRQHWYVYAYCRLREQFRFFKMFRIREMHIENVAFARQPIEINELPWDRDWSRPAQSETIVLRFERSAKHLAEEWFGIEELEEDEHGKYVVSIAFPEDNWLYGFILSFGANVEVVQPERVRRIIQSIAAQIADKNN